MQQVVYPKYFDRTLAYKKHCHNTKMKVQAGNNILRKLVGSDWGACPHTSSVAQIQICENHRN